MESEPIVDPTVRKTEYIRSTYTNGPRGLAVPMNDSSSEYGDSNTLANKDSNNGSQKVTIVGSNDTLVTPLVSKEASRLHKEYMEKRTLMHHENLRAKGNLSALKVLGLVVLAYTYMAVAVLLASSVELNL